MPKDEAGGDARCGVACDARLREAIAGREAAESRALEALAETDRLTRRIGHDLRAPLRALKIIPEWIREDLSSDAGQIAPQTEKHLSQLEQQAHRMDQFLIDLLELSRAGAAGGAAEWIDTVAEVEAVIAEARQGGGVTVEIAPELPPLRAVRADFATVMRHLVVNAIRHHDRDDRHIRIGGRCEGGSAIFEVEDDGPGIDERDRARIFEPFVTLRSRDEVEGSGLGLAVVAKIVRSWNGTVDIVPAAGRGAVFRVRIPVERTIEHDRLP